MNLFRDKQKDEGYKESEQGNEQSGYEGLKDFALPCMMVQITFLPGTKSVDKGKYMRKKNLYQAWPEHTNVLD